MRRTGNPLTQRLDQLASGVSWGRAESAHSVEITMSKGMDRKKEAKKKPAKTAAEKRAAKREKKQSRGLL